jgi:hypothetical protein
MSLVQKNWLAANIDVANLTGPSVGKSEGNMVGLRVGRSDCQNEMMLEQI